MRYGAGQPQVKRVAVIVEATDGTRLIQEVFEPRLQLEAERTAIFDAYVAAHEMPIRFELTGILGRGTVFKGEMPNKRAELDAPRKEVTDGNA